jgi:hypothetical protein
VKLFFLLNTLLALEPTELLEFRRLLCESLPNSSSSSSSRRRFSDNLSGGVGTDDVRVRIASFVVCFDEDDSAVLALVFSTAPAAVFVSTLSFSSSDG